MTREEGTRKGIFFPGNREIMRGSQLRILETGLYEVDPVGISTKIVKEEEID
jgi:hypothetical protein